MRTLCTFYLKEDCQKHVEAITSSDYSDVEVHLKKKYPTLDKIIYRNVLENAGDNFVARGLMLANS